MGRMRQVLNITMMLWRLLLRPRMCSAPAALKAWLYQPTTLSHPDPSASEIKAHMLCAHTEIASLLKGELSCSPIFWGALAKKLKPAWRRLQMQNVWQLSFGTEQDIAKNSARSSDRNLTACLYL